MSQAYDVVVTTRWGTVGVKITDGEVSEVTLAPEPGLTHTTSADPQDPLAAQVDTQIRAYVRDPGFRFTLPLVLRGTDFQRRVWADLRTIPAGTTLSYGELARRLGTSARAVGNACRANPCPLLVPCHRVVAAHGGLGGFSGQRQGPELDIKRSLLQHEGVVLL